MRRKGWTPGHVLEKGQCVFKYEISEKERILFRNGGLKKLKVSI